MAMLIMTVGLLGLLQSVNVAYEHNLRNRLREEAVMIAEEKMNDLRLYPSMYPSFTPLTTATRTVCGATRNFTIIKEASPMGGSNGSNRLKVAVHWGFKNHTSSHEIYSVKKL
jgi:type IV pilus assembly protein PilV